jgi:hypothetical protein
MQLNNRLIKFTLGLLISSGIAFVSCKKNALGGDADVVVTLKHHGKIIKNHVGYPDTVFVKFNATDLPGTGPDKFDTYFVGEVGEEKVLCENLRAGKYYFYGVGMDSAGPYRVTGGLAVKIKWAERKKKLNIDLAVTE